MTREEATNIPKRFGAEEGWTDTVEYILDTKNCAIRLLGRMFYFPVGSNESVDID